MAIFYQCFFVFCSVITFYNEMVQSRFFLACFLHILLEDMILFLWRKESCHAFDFIASNGSTVAVLVLLFPSQSLGSGAGFIKSFCFSCPLLLGVCCYGGISIIFPWKHCAAGIMLSAVSAHSLPFYCCRNGTNWCGWHCWLYQCRKFWKHQADVYHFIFHYYGSDHHLFFHLIFSLAG